jgi:hypothetical protein
MKGDPGFTENQKITKHINKKPNSRYDFILPPGEYEYLRIDINGYRTNALAIITDFSLLHFSFFFYSQVYLYLLAIIIQCMFVVPGTLIYTLFPGEKTNSETNLLSFFVFSIFFYLVLYLLLFFSLKTGLNKNYIVTAGFFIFTGLLFLTVIIRKKMHLFLQCLQKEKKTFIASIVIILASCFICTVLVREPFSIESVNHDTIDRNTIFSRFDGHDNLFQFVNGKAIADNEPFSQYYAGGKLIYDVQDREILGGVIYSVFRVFFSTFNKYIGESYLTYTIIGLCMNVMVIFPLLILFRRYFSANNQFFFLACISLNTFVLPNYYFTWFKFSGAALFLSGFLFLLQGRKKLLPWVVAGILLGLSSNMHAGNAMGIPFILLLIIFLNIKEEGLFAPSTLLFPGILTFVFVVMNLPWTIVKSVYYPDHHALIKQHFFPGQHKEGLLNNFLSFMETHPLKVQLQYRMRNLIDSFRFQEITELYKILKKGASLSFVRQWNNQEFFFFWFSIYPLSLMAGISRLFSKLFCLTPNILGTHNNSQLTKEAIAIFIVSMLTVISLVIVSYDRFPDINHKLPMGTVLIIHTLLIGLIVESNRIGRLLLFLYAGCSIWRITTFFSAFV